MTLAPKNISVKSVDLHFNKRREETFREVVGGFKMHFNGILVLLTAVIKLIR